MVPETGPETGPGMGPGMGRALPAAFGPAPGPARAGEIAADLAAAIGRTADGQVEIRLDPPELGRVRLVLSDTGTGLAAQVSAERPEILDLLRRHADVLARELERAGLGGTALGFADGREARQERPAPPAAAGPPGGPGAPPAPAPAPAPAFRRLPPAAAGGLDIRL
jgi:hypothetical protein